MQNIRIVNLPEMKAVYSGPLTDGEKFEKFITGCRGVPVVQR